MSSRSDETDGVPDALPLSGVRVLELSSFLAAPMATMFLADFGADVIKVERPGGGDEMRQWGSRKDGIGLYYKVLNRNKRSITADLRVPLGVEIVRRLAAKVDVVVENFRPGTLERWGLGFDALSAENRGLIMVRISGFGQSGPYSTRPGFGTLAEAFSGCAHITGEPGGTPLLPGFGLADATTGLCAAFLTMAALRARDHDGRGQVVDLAIYEPLFTLLGPHVVNYDQLGLIQQRQGSRLLFTAPRNTYRTRDEEWVAIAGSAQTTFERICVALAIPQLARDPRFTDNPSRLRNVDALDRELQAAIERFDLAELLERFARHAAPVSPVYNVAQIFEDPHYAARENIVSVLDEDLGPIRMQNVVGKLSQTPGRIRWAGPRPGQHDHDVLVEELGFDEADLADAEPR